MYVFTNLKHIHGTTAVGIRDMGMRLSSDSKLGRQSLSPKKIGPVCMYCMYVYECNLQYDSMYGICVCAYSCV